MGVKEMKKTAFSFLLLAGILLLAGCQKEARIGGKDAIQFSASTPGTKTVYSGDQTGAKEGIYWIGWDDVANQGDIIRIYSNKAVHRYNKDANTDELSFYKSAATGASLYGSRLCLPA